MSLSIPFRQPWSSNLPISSKHQHLSCVLASHVTSEHVSHSSHYPAFVEHLAEQDRMLPKYVQNEFEEYLKCGILSHGFLRVCCECCHHERHVADSTYGSGDADTTIWKQFKFEHTFPHDVSWWCFCWWWRWQERTTFQACDTTSSIRDSRVGAQDKRQTVQTLPAMQDDMDSGTLLGNVAGFSLHAGVAAKADERDKLERLCRYIARPLVSTKRISLTVEGNIRYELKTPYRDGTTHIIFEPLDWTLFEGRGKPR